MHSYPPYTAEAIRPALRTRIVGGRVELHRQVGSTNNLAREAGRQGEAEGLVVVAEEQVAGRGRLGRTWTAPPGCCVLCSVLLRPRFPAEQAFHLTIAASLAIHRACVALISDQWSGAPSSAATGNRQPTTAIKWPNDVLLNGKKLAGVLCESELSGRELEFCVVGFGINANLEPEDLGPLRSEATSLSTELGGEVDRTRLLASVLGELESLYILLQAGRFTAVREEWSMALETIGKHVRVEEPGGAVYGEAVRVGKAGQLVVRLKSGEERCVFAGDVQEAGHGEGPC